MVVCKAARGGHLADMNVNTDTSITHNGFLRMKANYVFPLFLKKIEQFQSSLILYKGQPTSISPFDEREPVARCPICTPLSQIEKKR